MNESDVEFAMPHNIGICGSDFQYHTGMEELFKCGRKRKAWHFFQW